MGRGEGRARQNWGMTALQVQGFHLGDENILELDRGAGCTTLNVLNATEFTLKWLVFCYVNFTSI